MTHPIGSKSLFETLADLERTGQDGVLATVFRTRLSTPRHVGSKMLIHADGTVTGSIGGGACEARVMQEALLVLEDRQCRVLDLDLAGGLGVCGGSMEVFLEPLLRSSPFVVIGAGHVGRALVQVGKNLSFRFLLVDDRPEFLEPWTDDPLVTTCLAAPEQLAEHIQPGPFSALLLASRNHQLDSQYLEAVLRLEISEGKEFGYLGALGSRSKANRILGQMQDLGAGFATRMKGVRMPVGLDLAAETPTEIALSVLAEALAILRDVDLLQDEQGKILGIPMHSLRGAKKDPS